MLATKKCFVLLNFAGAEKKTILIVEFDLSRYKFR